MSKGREQSGDAATVRGGAQLNPGDDAAPGTPGTGEDTCPRCRGTGRLGQADCPNCGGSGKIIEGIGGA